MLPVDLTTFSASLRISAATTVNPFPASPALLASMAAFKESILVSAATSLMMAKTFPIRWDFSPRLMICSAPFSVWCRMLSINAAASSMALALSSAFCWVDSAMPAWISLFSAICPAVAESSSMLAVVSPTLAACSEAPDACSSELARIWLQAVLIFRMASRT